MKLRLQAISLVLLLSATALGAQQPARQDSTGDEKAALVSRLVRLMNGEKVPAKQVREFAARLETELRKALMQGDKTDLFIKAITTRFEERARSDYEPEFLRRMVTLWSDEHEREGLGEILQSLESPRGNERKEIREEILAMKADHLLAWLNEVAVDVQTETMDEHSDWIVKAEPCKSDEPFRISGKTQAKKISYKVAPRYPAEARYERISGTVVLEVLISCNGIIENLKVLHGHPILVAAAVKAVSQWRYHPTYIEGEPVKVLTTVEVVFRN